MHPHSTFEAEEDSGSLGGENPVVLGDFLWLETLHTGDQLFLAQLKRG